MLLGGVFKATGNASPVAVPAKGRWMNDDMQRWAKRYGVTLRFNPHFPINTLTLMRGATGLQMHRPAEFLRYVEAVQRAMWETPRNLGDAGVLAATLTASGFDAAEAGRARRRARGQGQARRDDRGSGGARRLRRADLLRRRRRCSSARTGSNSCARRCSRAPEPRARQRSVRSFQISGKSTTSSIFLR